MDELLNAAKELAALSEELQDEIAKFNLGESVTSKEKGYTQANVGLKPVPERKIVEQKTTLHKPESSLKKKKEYGTADSMSKKGDRADVGSSRVSSLQTLTK